MCSFERYACLLSFETDSTLYIYRQSEIYDLDQEQESERHNRHHEDGRGVPEQPERHVGDRAGRAGGRRGKCSVVDFHTRCTIRG